MKRNQTFPKRALLALSAFVAVMIVLIANSRDVHAQQWTGPDSNGNISNANSGNVGIGTTSPDTNAKLHVYKAPSAGMDIQSAKYRWLVEVTACDGYTCLRLVYR